MVPAASMTAASWVALSNLSTTPNRATFDTISDPMASAVFPPALSTTGFKVAINSGAIIAVAVLVVRV